MVIIELSGMGRVKLLLIKENVPVIEKEIFLMRFQDMRVPIGIDTLNTYKGGYLEIVPLNFIVKNTTVKLVQSDDIAVSFEESIKI